MTRKIKFADPNFYKPGKVDALIGAEIFLGLLRAEKLYLKDSQLILQYLDILLVTQLLQFAK